MDMFKAMADPTRRRILQLLSEKNLSAGEIAEEFTMSKPAISKHLDILKTSELITCEKQGQYVIYAINTSAGFPIRNGEFCCSLSSVLFGCILRMM